ncbi:hypothetical protein Cantr_06124 [Candida viswanathii]|uniref:SPX domain-containing protein n=1 Tax=Candida viswanathii TaxID=5486 RepID=A0A367XW72_9ASCO|nr:hypothetical protein Cantr_06124 [Candida viswanathii]
MKFGDNLQQLSIPEWKSYNLDYNGLKYQIRQVTQSNSSDLSRLHTAFVDNFDYINLFIKTKFGELSRKFGHLQNQFNHIIRKQQRDGNEQLQQTLIIHLDDLFYQTIELSIDIKNLSKFIIIQKIAIKKIFKKFLKYYHNKQQANKFIIALKNHFLDNLNVNLNELTLKLTNLINVIKYESRTRSFHLKRNNSLFSISSALVSNSDYSNSILPTNIANNTPPDSSSSQQCTTGKQPCGTTPEACFDLNLLLKKNFQLHCLTNEDSINELMINFNLYFQLKNLNDNLMSFTFLTRDYLLDEPAYIVSHDDTNSSIIVAPIGGLRKYAYCILPNHIIQVLMDHLNDRDNDVYKKQLSDFFSTTNPSLLTKKTVDYVVSNDLKPTLKLFSRRARYTLEEEDEEDTKSTKASSTIQDNIDKDYMITLDRDIMTTDNLEFVNNLSFPENENDYLLFDIFPHNHLAIYSNDINLCNFENELITEIDLANGGVVKNDIGNIRKLPKKIQTILNNNSLTLFKGLNFYQYQLSCYHNIIPQGDLINNHYSNLLNLNLLKNFENIERNNQQLNEEVEIMRQKSDHILKHKQSIQSLSISAVPAKRSSRGSSHQQQQQQQPHSMGSSSLFDDNIIQEEPLTEEDENMDQISLSLHELINHDEDLFLKKLKKLQRQPQQSPHLHHEAIIPSFFDRLYDLKQRLFNESLSHQQNPRGSKKIHENPFFVDEDEVPLDPYTKLLSLYHTTQNYDSTYDSINEDPTPFLQRNHYQKTYEYNYDKTLSYVYFTLNLISIFLSGIQLGIFLSILQDIEYKFLIKDNVGIIVILILGILTSFIFCLISINLLFQRFSDAPMSHWYVVLTGLVVNLACWSWSVLLLINCF